jgi:hypothetical protein
VREDKRHASSRGGSSVHEVDALPSEVIESAKPPLPSTPIKFIRPVGHEVLQPIEVRALLPTYAGHLVGPSCIPQTCSQFGEHFLRDMNLDRFHHELLIGALPNRQYTKKLTQRSLLRRRATRTSRRESYRPKALSVSSTMRTVLRTSSEEGAVCLYQLLGATRAIVGKGCGTLSPWRYFGRERK